MKELWRSWGQRLRDRRGDMSQMVLAERAGVHQTEISRVELGKGSPRDKVRMAIAAALDTTVEDLFPYPREEQ